MADSSISLLRSFFNLTHACVRGYMKKIIEELDRDENFHFPYGEDV